MQCNIQLHIISGSDILLNIQIRFFLPVQEIEEYELFYYKKNLCISENK